MIFRTSYAGNLGSIALNLHNCSLDDVICKPSVRESFNCTAVIVFIDNFIKRCHPGLHVPSARLLCSRDIWRVESMVGLLRKGSMILR